MHVYVTNFDEKLHIMERKKQHAFIRTVESIDKLVQSLNVISSEQVTDSPAQQYHKRNNTKIRFKTKRQSNLFSQEVEWLNASKHEPSVKVTMPKKMPHRLSKMRAFGNIEPMFDSNDLIVIKAHVSSLLSVITSYSTLKEKYFKTNKMFNGSKTNVKFYRYIFWIPEHQGAARSMDYLTSYLKGLNAISKKSAFKIFILNWHLDIDWALSKLVDQVISNRTDFGSTFKSAGKYTLRLLNSEHFRNSTSGRSGSTASELNFVEKLQFRINDNNLILSEDLPFLFSSNNYNSGKKGVASKHRPTYRIVSTQVEPFVIVSQLDEHLVSKDECKDGLPCLDVESDIYNDNLYIFKDKKKHHLNGN